MIRFTSHNLCVNFPEFRLGMKAQLKGASYLNVLCRNINPRRKVRSMKSSLLIVLLGQLSFAVAPNIPSARSIYTFPNALPGASIEIEKSYDPATGAPRFISHSPYIKTADDLVKLERQEALLLRKKYGALTSDILREKYKALKAGDKLDVVVFLKQPEGIVYLDKTKNSMEDLKRQSLAIANLQPVASIPVILGRYGLKTGGKRSSHSFRVAVGKGDLDKMMFDNDIASIDEYTEGQPLQSGNPDFSTMANSAYNHSSSGVPSTAGSGINAATFETGIDPTVMSCWGGLTSSQIDQQTQPWTYWEHSQQTFLCLKNGAPAASLWHRQSVWYDDAGDSTYIINNDIQSMSLSYSRPGYGETSGEFRVMDDFAYRYPYPVFNTPTANSGYNYTAEWRSFNALNVGNVRHTNQSHFELVDTTNLTSGGCTQVTNPTAKYGSTNDREMPMLVAPGYTPSTTADMTDACLSNQYGNCGTSYSAPILNSMVTDVLAADSRIVGWPEKVRVVMLATAQNVDRGYWSYTSDGRDGAGVVDGAGAVAFAQGHTTVYPNNTAVVDGIGASSISSSDFAYPNNPIVYNIQIPNPKPSGKHLRVVLTWDSNPLLNSATNELSDLDLLVTSGSAGMASQSNNSNVEMVDIPNTTFTAGSTVEARISKWMDRIPSGGRASYFYYSIGWTWVKDHAD
jgi:hypothetical protein